MDYYFNCDNVPRHEFLKVRYELEAAKAHIKELEETMETLKKQELERLEVMGLKMRQSSCLIEQQKSYIEDQEKLISLLHKRLGTQSRYDYFTEPSQFLGECEKEDVGEEVVPLSPETTEGSGSEPVQERSSEEEENIPLSSETSKQSKKSKALTIADKLRLSLAADSTWWEPESPKEEAKSPKTSRSVEKIPEKPKTPLSVAKKAAEDGNQKPCSLMVTKLWRGLKKEDIVKHFGKFGKIIDCSETGTGSERADGYKYLFLKFSNSNAVDKAMENNGYHFIKNVAVGVKRGTHTF